MAQSETHSPYSSTTRLEAFSDGVFGIAITLLVLEICLPASTDPEKAGALLPGLLELWPSYLAYITSFLSICVLWVGHHELFHIIRHVDRPLLFINAITLMLITFLNFPTAILSEYIQKPDAQVAALFYSGTLFVIMIFGNAIWRYAFAHPKLLKDNFDSGIGRTLSRQSILGPTAYFIAALLALVNPILSVVLCFLAMIFFSTFLGRYASRTSA